MKWKRMFFRRKKVDVQDVFNRVIEAGFYTELEDWMCLSLASARKRGFISRPEYRQARDEIESFLTFKSPSLEWALERSGLPSDFESRLAIYRDWTNRPSLE